MNRKRTVSYTHLPTRELAIQVAEEIRRLAKYMSGIKVLPVYGGQEIVKQIRSLKGGVQIIVGTPGRVMDHMRRKTIRTDEIRTVVLDEADEMLNMGFLEDMETILSALPEERQTVMFSATMPQAIADIAKKFQKDPVLSLIHIFITKTKIRRSMTVIIAVCTVSALGTALVPNIGIFIALGVIVYAGYSVSVPVLQSMITVQSRPEQKNLVMGFFNATQSLGSIAGSLTAGFIYSVHAKLPFFCTFVIYGFGMLAAIGYMRYRGGKNAAE